jgi:drug/metabolite transporter (DMT)-like permease
MIKTVLLWSGIPIFGALAQICMKLTSLSFDQKTLGIIWLIEMSHSPWFWLSIGFDIAGFFCWILVLKNNRISTAFPLTSVSFVAVLVASRIIFDEPITPQHYVGTLFLLFGIYLLSKNDKLKK